MIHVSLSDYFSNYRENMIGSYTGVRDKWLVCAETDKHFRYSIDKKSGVGVEHPCNMQIRTSLVSEGWDKEYKRT